MEEGAEGGEEGQAGSADADLTAPAHGRGRALAAAPYLTVSAVSLWLTRAFWFPGSYVVGFDTYAYSGPNLEVTEQAWRSLRFPLVNDLIFGGVPHIGNPSAGAMYPPQALSLLFETNRTMGLLVALHVIVLGLGMTLLARRLDLSRVGAAATGVAAVAVGTTLTKTMQFEQILVIAWAPLLVASIHAVLRSRDPWLPVAAVAATTTAVLLAGHPQHVYQTMVLALAATIGFAIGNERWRRLPHLAGGLILGVLMAAPQLVAALHATADSALAGGREADLTSTALSLEPAAMVRALLGTVQDRDPAAFAGGFESIGFFGVVVALLAVIGGVEAIVHRRSRPWAISFGAVAAVALVWSMGPRTFVFEAAYDFLPGFDLARGSARWLTIVAFVVALFAGCGVDAIVADARRRHAAAAGLAVVAVSATLAVGIFDIADRRSALIWAVTAVIAVGLVTWCALGVAPRSTMVATALVIGLAAIELVAMSMHSIPQNSRTSEAFTSHDTATTSWLAAQDGGTTIALTDDGASPDYQVPGLRPNANALAGIASIDGYDGGVQITQRWADALRRFTPTPLVELPLRNSLQLPIEPAPLARLGVRFIILDRDRPADVFIPGWEGPRASDEWFTVWENPLWLGDAVAWPNSRTVEQAPADVLREDRDPATAATAIVDRAGAVLDCGFTVQCAPTGLDVDRRSPEQLVIETDLDVPAIVSVDQQALPGWSVEIDGEAADEVLVDGLFLGVEVPAGIHTVTWRYHSPGFTLTLVLAFVALLATVGVVAFGTVGRSQRQRGHAGGPTCDDPS